MVKYHKGLKNHSATIIKILILQQIIEHDRF